MYLYAETPDYATQQCFMSHWRELVESDLEPVARFADGAGALYQLDRYRHLAGWPERDLRRAVILDLCRDAQLGVEVLPPGVRLRRRGNVCFAFNYGPKTATVPAPENTRFLMGHGELRPGEIAAWWATAETAH